MQTIASGRLIRICCLCGLVGSTLFLVGDMLFYGTLSSGAQFHPYTEMAERSVEQLVIGGTLGPVAAVFSAVGMGIFGLTLASANRRLAWAAAALLAIMMVIGGAYHAIYAVFGFAAKIGEESVREALTGQVANLRNTISYPMYATGIAGSALVYFLALWKRTQFPRWLLIFLPTTLSMVEQGFRGLFRAIPAPLGGIVRGGWINGSFVLFFAIATCHFWRTEIREISPAKVMFNSNRQ
ncbi:MAG TPA: DUF6796 family protein [Candidatus Angelobacter sp.]|nr:DUF6796 family protein [Candidatus Angelobacter sp.]